MDEKQYGLEEIEAELARRAQDDSVGGAIQTGIAHGVTSTINKGEVFLREVLSRVGALDEEQYKKASKAGKVTRAKHAEERLKMKHSTTANVTNFAGEMLPYLALPAAGGIPGAMGGGALAGALENEGDRVGGAVQGAAIAGAVSGAFHGIRKLIPERVPAKEKAFKDMGVRPKRSDLLSAKLKQTSLQKQAQKVVPKEEATTYTRKFTDLLNQRKEHLQSKVDKYMDEVLGGGLGEKVMPDVNAVTSTWYNQVRQQMLRDSSTGAKTFVKKLDGFFAKRPTVREVQQALTRKGEIGGPLESLYTGASKASFDTAQLGTQMVNRIKDNFKIFIQYHNPGSVAKYDRAMALASKKIGTIENMDVTKAIKAGNFDTIISTLSKTTGRQTLKEITKALGPQVREILEKGVVRRAFEKSFSASKGLNVDKFYKTIDAVTKNSGLKMSSQSKAALKGVKYLLQTAEQGKKDYGAVVNMIRDFGGYLWESPVGIKVFTKAAAGSAKDVRAKAILDILSTAAAKTESDFGVEKPEQQQESQGYTLDDIDAELKRRGELK